MDERAFSISPSAAKLAEEVRQFVADNLPADIHRQALIEPGFLLREPQQRWYRLMLARGWGAAGYPSEHGGPGWTDEELYMYSRELGLGDAPRPMLYGLRLFGPTLLHFGTEAQKARFLPGILSGETLWCQGYSEPNAGSDLSAIACAAERDGDHYRINGLKVWTSDAHFSDWMYGLFRTRHDDARKTNGLTFLMLDLRSPGVTIRPLKLIEGTHEINEVHFDNVLVPADQRLGEEHDGWPVSQYLMARERLDIADVARSMATLKRLKERDWARVGNEAAGADPARSDLEIAGLECELRALDALEHRLVLAEEPDAEPALTASMLKLLGTDLQQRLFETILDRTGRSAQTPELELDCPEAAHVHYRWRATTIYGGTSEIMHEIAARRLIGPVVRKEGK